MTDHNKGGTAAPQISAQEAEKVRGDIFATLTTLRELAALKLPKDRSSSIAITKMDEARLWLFEPFLMAEVSRKAAESQEVANAGTTKPGQSGETRAH